MKNNNLICRKTKSTFRKKSYGKINSLYVSQKSIFMHFRTKSRSNFKFSSKFPRHSKQNRIKTKLVTKKFDAIEKQYKHTQTIKFYDLCKFLSISLTNHQPPPIPFPFSWFICKAFWRKNIYTDTTANFFLAIKYLKKIDFNISFLILWFTKQPIWQPSTEKRRRSTNFWRKEE